MKVALLMDRPRWCKKSARNERLLWNAYLKEREILEELAKRKRERDEWLAQLRKRIEEYQQLRKREHENRIDSVFEERKRKENHAGHAVAAPLKDVPLSETHGADDKLTNTETDYVMTECEKENVTLSFRSREQQQQQFPEQQQQLPECQQQ